MMHGWISRPRGLLLVAGFAAGACAWGCEKEVEQFQTTVVDTRTGEHVPRTEQGYVKQERILSVEELDTLRVWKERLKLTRDEYWDDYGGVVANEWGEVWYSPGTMTITHGMYAFMRLADARQHIRAVFSTVPAENIKLVCTISMEIYMEGTGQQWWHYSVIKDRQIILQPVPVLFQRGIVDVALPHEYYRWAIQRFSRGNTPRWVEHGFASVLSGELGLLVSQLKEFMDNPVVQPLEETDAALRAYTDKEASRIAAYNARQNVSAIVDQYGEESLAAMILALGAGQSLDDASRVHLGESWDQVATTALVWQEGWTR